MSLPKFKLISFSICPYVQRARIVLLEKGIEHEIEYIDLDNPPAWFYDISPLEKVPVLLADDTPLFESMPICEYINEITDGSFYPGDPLLRAQHRAWIEFGNSMLGQLYSIFTTAHETAFKQAKGQLVELIETMEETLSGSKFYYGDNFGMVDAVFAPIHRYAMLLEELNDFGFYTDSPLMQQWGQNLLAQPSVQQAVTTQFKQEYYAYLRRQNSYLAKTLLTAAA